MTAAHMSTVFPHLCVNQQAISEPSGISYSGFQVRDPGKDTWACPSLRVPKATQRRTATWGGPLKTRHAQPGFWFSPGVFFGQSLGQRSSASRAAWWWKDPALRGDMFVWGKGNRGGFCGAPKFEEHPYCGWTKSCTKLKPWETIVCWYLQRNYGSSF